MLSAGLVMPDGDGQSEGKCTVLCPAHAVRLFMNRASSTQGSNAQVTQSDLLPGTRHAAAAQGVSHRSLPYRSPLDLGMSALQVLRARAILAAALT